MMSYRNNRRGKPKRVHWNNGQGCPKFPFEWQCTPDVTSRAERGLQERQHQNVHRDEAEFPEIDVECPCETIRLRSASGDLIETDASSLWKISSIVRSLIEDSGPEEDIPIPGASTKALLMFISLCSEREISPLEEHRHRILSEVFWIAKLLDVLRRPNTFTKGIARLVTSGQLRFSDLPVLILFAEEALSEAASSIRASMVPGLEQLLSHSNCDVRKSALDALQRMCSSTLETRIVLLKHSDYSVRMRAARSMKPDCPKAIRALEPLFHSPSFQVREAATIALAVAAPHGDPTALEHFVRLLEDPVREVRGSAADGIRQVATIDCPTTVSAVVKKVLHEDWPIRCDALKLLSDIATDKSLIEDLAAQITGNGSTAAKLLVHRVLTNLQKEADSRVEDTEADETDCSASSRDGQITSPKSQRSLWSDDLDDEEFSEYV
eukprot:TRINITY_DN31712_c0_g1_i2.p1 TRINITY_DN31712_c0_g1~~TRINITY_DN31712_c0_g1_i2.p1  ORF type:complete len:438 (+),score=61.82 TRINITY_DN31712_c0_g1_i2:76-1389(+)